MYNEYEVEEEDVVWEPTETEKRVGAARLLRLADMLTADAQNETGIKFDLGVWGEVAPGANGRVGDPEINCGTTACAVGLACLSKEFQAEGLNFDMHRSIARMIPIFIDGDVEWRHWDAVTRFFGINEEQSYWMFSSQSYRWDLTKGATGELAVAERIREFVKGQRELKADGS